MVAHESCAGLRFGFAEETCPGVVNCENVGSGRLGGISGCYRGLVCGIAVAELRSANVVGDVGNAVGNQYDVIPLIIMSIFTLKCVRSI